VNSSTFGRAGELKAAAAFRKKGFKIIAENYRAGPGELDIVAYKRGLVVFVEVKTRSGSSFGGPADAVGGQKRQRIVGAAEQFLREQQSSGCVLVYSRLLRKKTPKRVKRTRFDIAEVFMSRDLKRHSVNIIENAFDGVNIFV